MAKSGEQAAEPLLSQPPPPSPPPSDACYGYPVPDAPAYVLYPLQRRRRRRCRCRCCSNSPSALVGTAAALLFIAALVYVFWPSDPQIQVVRMSLEKIQVSTDHGASLDISMSLVVRIRNPDFFALDYDSIIVFIVYRGKLLGSVTSEGGHVKARGVSYVDADLHLDGVQVVEELIYLIADLARGSIPLDTVTEVDGQVHVLFFDVPIQGRISCSVHVNPSNQTIVRQDCFPE